MTVSARRAAGAGVHGTRRWLIPSAVLALVLAAGCGEASSGRHLHPQADLLALRDQAAVLSERVEKLEARVMRDPELQRMNLVLGGQLLDGMVEADPLLPRALQRVPDLEASAAAARAGGDAAALRQARRELAAVSRRFQEAREAALRNPGLAGRVTAFNQLLRERMLSSDPSAARLLARYQRVLEQLQTHGGAASGAEGSLIPLTLESGR